MAFVLAARPIERRAERIGRTANSSPSPSKHKKILLKLVKPPCIILLITCFWPGLDQTKVNDVYSGNLPDIPEFDDDKTIAMDNDETVAMDDENTTAIREEIKTLTAKNPTSNKLRTEVPMETNNRVQRGLDNLEGEIISGRYKILRRIGKGGMGVVYLAQQTNLNRNVCIKVLNPALLDDEDAVSRFEREAKGLSRLQHPNIVTIFDYGRDGNLAYIVMEYAQGETLN